MPLPRSIAEVAAEATGRQHRNNPVIGPSGGAAGNARLTAWTGMVLLVLVLAQLVTLLDVGGLISWHVVLGSLLVGVALLKTGSTTWRVVRYYTGSDVYRVAGPPPTPLRILGPFVVVTTLGLLGSGLTLVALGPAAGRHPFITVAGIGIDALTVHQIFFFAFAGAAGLHLLARIVPAVVQVSGRIRRTGRVSGGSARTAALLVALALAALTASLIIDRASAWR